MEKLTETEKTEVKSHNSALQKKRRRADDTNNNAITTRRVLQLSVNNDNAEPSEKRQRTVQILQNKDNG